MTTPPRKTAALDILVEDLGGSQWVAAIRHNTLVALEIDPQNEMIRWGSIYWARVLKIDTRLNAAIVDLGYELEALLPASEVVGLAKGQRIGQRLKPGQFLFVQVKTARQPVDDTSLEGGGSEAAKLSKVSTDITIQGRFLIHTPFSPGNRISRRIRSPETRAHLTAMLKSIKGVENCILRASAADTQTDLLIREAKILHAIWESLQQFTTDTEAALLMLGQDAAQRVLSDLSTRHIGSIQIADEALYEETETWCDLYAPEWLPKLQERKVTGTRNGMGLMEARDVLGEIQSLVRPYVILPSGGSLIIEETAIGTTIDINQGAAKQTLSLNLEAADEIARQIRLRNLGGTILIDCAGSKTKADMKRILARFETAIQDDPCTVECLGDTKGGLIELQRARRTPSLMDRITLMQGDTDE